jgi:hypothetical protein
MSCCTGRGRGAPPDEKDVSLSRREDEGRVTKWAPHYYVLGATLYAHA